MISKSGRHLKNVSHDGNVNTTELFTRVLHVSPALDCLCSRCYLDLQLCLVIRAQACEQEAAQEEEVSSSHWLILLEKSHTRTSLAVFFYRIGTENMNKSFATGECAVDLQKPLVGV